MWPPSVITICNTRPYPIFNLTRKPAMCSTERHVPSEEMPSVETRRLSGAVPWRIPSRVGASSRSAPTSRVRCPARPHAGWHAKGSSEKWGSHMKSRLWAVVLVLCVTLIGCSATREPRSVPEPGFLAGDYSRLKKGTGSQPQLYYVNPNTNWKNYTQMLVDHVFDLAGCELRHQGLTDGCAAHRQPVPPVARLDARAGLSHRQNPCPPARSGSGWHSRT